MKFFTYLLFLSFVTACASPDIQMDLADKTFQEPQLSFQWPVYGAIVTQAFRPYTTRYKRRKHRGVDLASKKNTPIFASEDGTVTYASRGIGYRGYGKVVVIKHQKGAYKTYYAHLSQFKVKRGDTVRKGQMIGLMGKTGRATGVHLHFEIRKDKEALDPMSFLQKSFVTHK